MSSTAVSDAPLSFEAFKKYHDTTAPPHRRLYVIHAHAYFQYTTEAEKAKAQEVHAAIKAEFAGNSGVRIGPIVEKPSAVHVTPQFETSFTKPNLVHVIPWFMFNRPEGFSVLIHPFTAELVEQHTSRAMWLGEKTGINLPPLAKAEQQVGVEVANGGDEASLLWKFA